MTLKYLPAFLLATLLIVFFVFASDKPGKNDFEPAKKMIVMRMIGHEILLHAGDSGSRVLPVKQVVENEYQLQFENPFTFEPDSLVSIIHRVITTNRITSDYIVNVTGCSGNEIIYGYAILKAEQNDIIPCKGRKQLKRCYYINILFPGPAQGGFQKIWLVAGISGLVLVLSGWGLQLYYKRKRAVETHEKLPDAPEAASLNNRPVQIGRYLFDYEGQYLSIDEEKTALTMKESALLFIFAMAPNQVVDRSRLQKEIWEDEGVIVGRSLDMFVSKLRKKLEKDPAIRLVNIHGKGYKLEV